MKAALTLLAYILLYGLLTDAVLDNYPGKLSAWLLMLGFFPGWFIALGMAALVDGGAKATEVVRHGPADGISFMVRWLHFAALLVLVSFIAWVFTLNF